MKDNIIIKSNIKTYSISFCDLQNNMEGIIQKTDIFFVDSKLKIFAPEIWEQISDKKIIILDANETTKSIAYICDIYNEVMQNNTKRISKACIIGGGTIQDAAGFICSTFMRGIDYIHIPTTLLSQSDSCMGGKTSVNIGCYKNIIGTFYPPSNIYIDPSFVKTQNNIDFYSGIGEMVKICIAGGKETTHILSKLLATNISQNSHEDIETLIDLSLKIKLPYVEQDEYDTGILQLLNYGHCFGHALEASSNYEIPHGQAVLLGIWATNILSIGKQKMHKEMHNEIIKNLIIPALKIKINKKQINVNKIIEAMLRDKKRCNELLTVICLNNDYTLSKIDNITTEDVSETLSAFKKQLLEYGLL